VSLPETARFFEWSSQYRSRSVGIGKVELSIWPASYGFTETFDLDFVRSCTDAGAARVAISQGEAQTADIGGQRDFIRRYQDEILANVMPRRSLERAET